ncbi:MAG TPA: thiamine biosynthesis protein ThiS [Dehalococcoidia bacterium]|nr:thiamine biosynthesis protein ThiS [Dehalococcoidia bacterium]
MKVLVRLPRRQTFEFEGRRPVSWILKRLDINPETVIVIRGDELLTADDMVEPEDEIEVRPAISGGER